MPSRFLRIEHLVNMVYLDREELIIIQTKVKFPFIYFFVEPNVVFVFKIKTTDYVTVSTVSDNGEWETYELMQGETFDAFHHEETKPLEGRGYFIQHNDLNAMVEMINKTIQLHRRYSRIHSGASVHIVSPEFAAGTLRVGLQHPKTVIGFPDFLSIGPLWKLDEKIGQVNREEWLTDNINFELDEVEYQTKCNNVLREIEDLSSDVPIYIWYGENADEQTGLRFILNVLKNKENDLFLMNSTALYKKYFPTKKNENSVFHTGQIEPKEIKFLFEKGEHHPLSQQERVHYQSQWESLSQTKEVLRVWEKDKIIGVPEDFYDEIIIKTLEKLHHDQENKDFINTGMVIGSILEEMEEPIGHFYLEYRIRHLIYSGKLELKGIPKSMRHYRIKLRS
ncbi:DUF1835 domain-containing protein [Bacillus dakarensis]|uniref:DUF1835 domain-containing protein n=1 Tax=Robertmurraya dakarensis TaxID=1926278 RepID=UPI001F36DB3A|nr:DUF1835 domain-containing protein [Bacillus dakarensis]